MSRDEQMSYWQEGSNAGQKREPSLVRFLSMYDEIGYELFFELVCKHAAADDFEEFLSECPVEIIQRISESLSCYGDDESKWPRTWFGTSYAPWVSAEKAQEAHRRKQEQFWDGIRILKSKIG